jgi:hypothetical protein
VPRAYARDHGDPAHVNLIKELMAAEQTAGHPDDGGRPAPVPPLICVEADDGRLILADGRSRMRALLDTGVTEVEVHVIRSDGRDPVEQAFELSVRAAIAGPRPLSESEMRRALVRLLDGRPTVAQ